MKFFIFFTALLISSTLQANNNTTIALDNHSPISLTTIPNLDFLEADKLIGELSEDITLYTKDGLTFVAVKEENGWSTWALDFEMEGSIYDIQLHEINQSGQKELIAFWGMESQYDADNDGYFIAEGGVMIWDIDNKSLILDLQTYYEETNWWATPYNSSIQETTINSETCFSGFNINFIDEKIIIEDVTEESEMNYSPNCELGVSAGEYIYNNGNLVINKEF